MSTEAAGGARPSRVNPSARVFSIVGAGWHKGACFR
jgi:hypothetical protein